MTQTPLITIATIQEFKGISANINEVKDLTPHILEAQEFDLRKFLGESFYLAITEDFTSSPSLSTYGDLFNGQKYTYKGLDYQHEGLRAILVYHSYARYIVGSGVQSTVSGFVQKTSQFSDKIDPQTLSILTKQARSGANAHETRVKDYLDRHSASFPLWNCSGKSTNYKNGARYRRI